MGSEEMLRFEDVKRRIKLGRTSVYEQIKAGKFPRPFRLGQRAVGWKQSDISAWIESRQRTALAKEVK